MHATLHHVALLHVEYRNTASLERGFAVWLLNDFQDVQLPLLLSRVISFMLASKLKTVASNSDCTHETKGQS